MENEKEEQNNSCITTISTAIDSSVFIMTDWNYSDVVYPQNTSSNYVLVSDGSDVFTYTPYAELEETRQQQEKEEELRKENSCLQEAWDEYQLILKLLEENECDKFVEKRYGIKND